jgi:cell wall-associated NlpC family hydrolase
MFKTFALSLWDGLVFGIRLGANLIGTFFTKMRTGVDLVRQGFAKAVSAIKTIWNGLKEAARAPVKWVIDVVYRGGIVKVWDAIRKVVPRLPKLPEGPRLAAGGILPGYTPGRDIWKLPLAMFSGGEAIMRPEVTRVLGERFIHGANAAARNGGAGAVARFVAGDPGGLVHGSHNGRNFDAGRARFAKGGIVQHFQDGGILGTIKGVLKGAGNIVSKVTGLARSVLAKGAKWVAERILKPLIDKLPSGTDLWGALGGIAKSALNGFLDFIVKVIEPNLTGGATGVVRAARSQLGVPYSWGGGGKGGPSYGIQHGRNIFGFDCSGLTEYAWWKGAKKSIGGTTYTQWPNSRPIGGQRAGALGFPHRGHVVIGSDKPGFIIEAPFTGARVRETRRAMASWRWPRSADNGGYLEPGLNVLMNRTGGHRERILDPAETSMYESARGGPNQTIIINTNEINPRRHAAELGWELSRRSGF